MPLTLTIGDELAAKLKPFEGNVSELLELGIREWQARGEAGYHGVRGVLEKLATLPAPEEVLALRPSAALQERVEELLEKNRTSGLSEQDEREWKDYEYLENLVRLAKTNALRKLKGSAK